MSAHENARELAGSPGAEAVFRGASLPAKYAIARRRQLAYARTFQLGPNGAAVLCIGWPPTQPPAGNVLVLPADAAPDGFDFGILLGAAVFVTPPPGVLIDPGLLREAGSELAAAGVRCAAFFDGSQVVGEYWCDPAERPRVPS